MIKINHLYNNDCLHIMQEMEDESVKLILTDPPYGVAFTPQRKRAKERLGDRPVMNDEIQDEQWVEWFTPICKELYRVLEKDSVAYMFSGFKVDRYYYSIMEECGFNIKAVMIWVKNNFGLGYHFRRQYEKIVVGFKGNPPTPDKAISDVVFDKKVNGKDLRHSCQKPLPILETLLKQYTEKGDIIFEPFAGSCSHVVACIRTDRNWIACELDEHHYKNGLERLRISEKGIYVDETMQLPMF